MELANIEHLLEAYFEGNTTLEEEATLCAYFKNGAVPSHLEAYRPLFIGLSAARTEVSEREVRLPTAHTRFWRYGIAATVAIAIGVAGFVYTQPELTPEEREALAAFEKTKEAMKMLSENFNEGAEELAIINQFTITKNKILK
jgi:hypothetical protein